MFRGLVEFATGPPPRDRPDANYGRPCQFLQKHSIQVSHGTAFGWESQGPLELHGYGSTLICEVTLMCVTLIWIQWSCTPSQIDLNQLNCLVLLMEVISNPLMVFEMVDALSFKFSLLLDFLLTAKEQGWWHDYVWNFHWIMKLIYLACSIQGLGEFLRFWNSISKENSSQIFWM